MKKKVILVIGIVIVIAIIVAVSLILFFNKPQGEYEDIYLDDVEIDKKIDNLATIYSYDNNATVDELNRKINTSEALPLEKFVMDNKVGFYNFAIVSDFESSTLTFVIKNHTKEKVEKFNYRLQLIDKEGTVLGTIDIDSKELPALSKYKVKVNIDSDISDIYDIIPVTDFNTYGKIGGGYYEDK